ncbi:MAG: M23 family metallopeptidase [Rhodobacteraceae bacterium]|nr:M23 family metallopeptidase [Paracoccaceae bacterium]
MRGAFAAAFPEKRISIHSTDGARHLRLTTAAQALAALAVLATTGWLAMAAADRAVGLIAAAPDAGQTLVLEQAYRDRLNGLTEERDLRAAEALSAQNRFQTAMEQIGRQQTSLLRAIEERRELATALDLMRGRLGQAVKQRDDVAAANDGLLDRMNAVSASLSAAASGEDLTETLQAVTGALAEAVEARDGAAAERAALAKALAETELELALTTRRQDAMIDELQQAVAASFGPLEGLLARADLDVDSLLATVRRGYSGQGGPLVPVGVSTRSSPDAPATTSRFDSLMIDIDRMNLLRIAIGKVPYAMPVRAAHRFSSNFGYRRDPKGGGRRMHSGVDFAAPRGTPIYATADGVVTSAKSESGYGLTVRVQHEFGFETVYAHQSRLRVEAGQQVSRGDHIGDMGSTGRSTGNHLHYEVHVGGSPVNPMTYVEAAKDVF